MQTIQGLLDNSSFPIITAFLLGILTSISPCPLATNITAIGFISKDIENKKKIFLSGLYYTLGRVIVYTLLALVLIPLIKQGTSIYGIKKVIANYGGYILSPTLIVIGLAMLFYDKLKFLPKLGINIKQDNIKRRSGLGALWLGVLFALAFCPSSAIFYFGGLIPLAVVESESYLLAVVFAIATSLPVIIVAWILSFSVSSIGKFYKNMKVFEKWIRVIVSFLFIGVGIYYFIIFIL